MKDNQAKYPQLRFKGFTDPWEERKLADVVSISAGGDVDKTKLIEDGGYPVLANALTNSGIVGYYDSYKVEAPAVTVTGRGDVGHAVARHVNFTPVVRLLSLKSEVLDADFLANMLNQTNILVESTGVPQLTAPQLGSYKILYPNLNEQTKIGKLLNAFDNLIALHQRKLDLLKEQKKGYLQKMFPKNGAKVPELRFAGFADDWEQRKFKDILKTHSFRSYLAGVSENGEYEVIQQGDKPIVGYSDGEPFTDYKDVTLFGDHTVSLYKPKSPFFVATDGVKILSADNFEGDYLYTTLERYKPEPQGYKRHFTILKNQDVWFTENMEEQQKIGVFFKQLDDTITLHQRKLDLLKEQKKGFLQKMFV